MHAHGAVHGQRTICKCCIVRTSIFATEHVLIGHVHCTTVSRIVAKTKGKHFGQEPLVHHCSGNSQHHDWFWLILLSFQSDSIMITRDGNSFHRPRLPQRLVERLLKMPCEQCVILKESIRRRLDRNMRLDNDYQPTPFDLSVLDGSFSCDGNVMEKVERNKSSQEKNTYLPKLYEYGAFALFAFMTVVLFDFINLIQPIPFIDEIFHIPQAQRYCLGQWSEVSVTQVLQVLTLFLTVRSQNHHSAWSLFAFTWCHQKIGITNLQRGISKLFSNRAPVHKCFVLVGQSFAHLFDSNACE